MSLAVNAHPYSAKCELIAADEDATAIANALIGQSFFGKIKLVPVMADNYGTVN